MFIDLGFTATNIISNGARQASEWRGQLGDLQAAIQALGTSLPLVALSGASLVLPGERVSGAGIEDRSRGEGSGRDSQSRWRTFQLNAPATCSASLVLPGERVSGAGIEDRSRGEGSGRDSQNRWRTFQLNPPATCSASLVMPGEQVRGGRGGGQKEQGRRQRQDSTCSWTSIQVRAASDLNGQGHRRRC